MFTVGGLSGVILANASLDIAFHDRGFILLFTSLTAYLFINNINNDYLLKSHDKEYNITSSKLIDQTSRCVYVST